MQSITTASTPSCSASMILAMAPGTARAVSNSLSIEPGPVSISTWLTDTPGNSSAFIMSGRRNPRVVMGTITRTWI